MSKSRSWEVDKLAARRVLDCLKIETTPAAIEEVAMEFAQHRQDVEQWVAGRVQSNIVGALEARSMLDFGQMDENWANGFRAAEELVARMSSNELLDQPAGKAQSKGQVLRSMVRAARRR